MQSLSERLMEICLEVERSQTGWESLRRSFELRIQDQDRLIGQLRSTFPAVDAHLNGRPYKKPRKKPRKKNG